MRDNTVPDLVERAHAVNTVANEREPAPAATPFRDGPRIALPRTEPPALPLGAALAARRSRYRYGPALELSALAGWLEFSLGVQRFVPAYGVDEHPLSRAPSAGGLTSRRGYVVARAVSGLAPGVYRHDPVTRELVTLGEGDPVAALERAYLQPEFARLAAVTVVLTARLDVAFGKYPLRHYRTLHVDAGVAVQNLYLVGTALGLSGCAVSGFDDNAVTAMLRLPREEIPTVLFAAGSSTPSMREG